VRHYPGIRPNIPFWDDEFNSIGAWDGSDDSVQAKYVPRGMIYNWAAGVRTFVWLLAAGTDGNEYDDFGFIHGLRNLPDDFTPRPVFAAYQNTNALFSDTKPDASIKIDPPEKTGFPFFGYAFRSAKGKAIVAYWLGAHSNPGNKFAKLTGNLIIHGSGIAHPVLIDVVSGAISRLDWKKGTTDTLESLPLRDSILAIADETYFDWPVLPEAPSGLKADADSAGVKLSWEVHEGNPTKAVLERRTGNAGNWSAVSKLAAGTTTYTDTARRDSVVCYRVRAATDAGQSAYSNIARVGQ
jgi:hypothetical protein